MKKIALLGILMTTWGIVLCQDAKLEIGYRNFLPPSPTSYELGKYGQIPVSLSTGTPKINVPLYTFSTQNLSVPISLSYYSNGIKVDQVASWVGLGWSLNAGGVITRLVRDREDENTSWTYPEDITNMQSIETMNYLSKAADDPNFDTEPDIYSFNFMNFTGKFFFKRDGHASIMPHQNLKIDRFKNAENGLDVFQIITPDGTIYKFGGAEATEKSKNDISGGCARNYDTPLETAWYLTSIKHPYGDEIRFEYKKVDYTYISGVQQTIIRRKSTFSSCAICPQPPIDPPCSTFLNVNGVKLERIVSDFNGEVTFEAGDGSFRSQLNNITVLNNNSDIISQFSTKTHTTSNNRVFLTEILETDGSGDENRLYLFDYYDMEGVPERLSKAQDHWGYYNGEHSNQYLYPVDLEHEDSEGRKLFEGYGGNREPNSSYSVKGLLSKTTYPTGGFNKFNYEPHTYYGEKISYPTSTMFNKNGQGTGLKDPVTITEQLYIFNNEVKLHYSVSSADEFANGSNNFTIFKIINLNTASVVYNERISVDDNAIERWLNLTEGDNYLLELTTYGESTNSNVRFNYYATAPQVTMDNIDIGGHRIREIVSNDGNSENNQVLQYYYASRFDLNKSSGVNAYQPNYNSYYSNIARLVECKGTNVCEEYICWYGSLHSDTQYSLYNLGGASVAYQYVTVSYGNNFENGGIEYEYNVQKDTPGKKILGTEIVDAPYNNSGWQNGLEKKVTSFRIEGSNNQIVLKEVINDYTNDTRNENTSAGLVVKKRYQLKCQPVPYYECRQEDIGKKIEKYRCTFDHSHLINVANKNKCWSWRGIGIGIGPNPYNELYTQWESPCNAVGEIIMIPSAFDNLDAIEYKNISFWHYLNSMTTVTYDEKGLNPITSRVTYEYNNPEHAQLTSTKTLNSIGDSIITKTYYADDYTDNVMNMVVLKNNHMVSLPIKTETSVDDFQVSGKVFIYNDNGQATHTYLYETQDKKNAIPHLPSLLIPSTDYALNSLADYSQGTIRELIGSDGVNQAFIWGYGNSQVTAHIQNALPSQVGYTSFEAKGLGNWVVENTNSFMLSDLSRSTHFKTYRSQQVSYNGTMINDMGDKLSIVFSEDKGEQIVVEEIANSFSGTITNLPPGIWKAEIFNSKKLINPSLTFSVVEIKENIASNPDAKHGSYSTDIGSFSKILKGGVPKGKYLLKYYRKNANVNIVINGVGQLGQEKISMDGDWELVNQQITIDGNNEEIQLSGTGLIDYLVLIPSNAFITTYNYDSNAFLSSKTDANNVTTYYEYDNFGRLIRVRDNSKNILKTYDYNYMKGN